MQNTQDKLTNQLEFVITREEVNRLLTMYGTLPVNTSLSDEQWVSFSSELDNNIEGLIQDEIIKYSLKDINFFVEEDKKCN